MSRKASTPPPAVQPIDLEPALRALQTIHPNARGAVIILHDADGRVHTNCASFYVDGSDDHYNELRTLVNVAPVAAADFHKTITDRARRVAG